MDSSLSKGKSSWLLGFVTVRTEESTSSRNQDSFSKDQGEDSQFPLDWEKGMDSIQRSRVELSRVQNGASGMAFVINMALFLALEWEIGLLFV